MPCLCCFETSAGMAYLLVFKRSIIKQTMLMLFRELQCPSDNCPGNDTYLWHRYNKISCIEMAEHVGIKNFQTFLLQVRDLLEDDGLFLLQIAGLRRAFQVLLPTSILYFKHVWRQPVQEDHESHRNYLLKACWVPWLAWASIAAIKAFPTHD